MKKSFIILISIAIILTGCIHSDNNILTTHNNQKQPKQENEKDKSLVFSMRNNLFEESKSLQMFPFPDKAILVDKTFKYAAFNFREKHSSLSDIMPLYLQEIEKMGWFKEKHFGQQWIFENEGVRVHLSTQEDSFTIREIEIYSAQ